MRATLVVLHRCAGLVLAGFLLVAGLTGSLLAWNDELEAVINPALFLAAAPSPTSEALDPLDLRERVQAAYPRTFVARAPLHAQPGHAMVFRLHALPDPTTGKTPELPNDQVFVNPYTGALQGERKWGDITQGIQNLMPFVLRLHDSLALDGIGRYVMGVIALLWSLDCFVGAVLTLPPRSRGTPRTGWPARWWPAWTLRWRTGGHKLVFDLHRAVGLWPWAMLFVVAWSSLAFNLREVYNPVMRTLLAHQMDAPAARLAQPLLAPPVDWRQARDIGRARLAEQAHAHGFVVHAEYMLIYDPRSGDYGYYARTDRDVSERWGITRVGIDANTGNMTGLWLPTGTAAGDTIRSWITTLHMAALWGWPMQLFVCVIGLAVAMLSVTGVLIWARRRRARRMRVLAQSTAQLNVADSKSS